MNSSKRCVLVGCRTFLLLRRDSGSRPSSFISEPPSPKTPKLSQSDHNIEELGPAPEQRSISKQERESDGNDEIFDDVSENVKFDSDESEVLRYLFLLLIFIFNIHAYPHCIFVSYPHCIFVNSYSLSLSVAI